MAVDRGSRIVVLGLNGATYCVDLYRPVGLLGFGDPAPAVWAGS